jgi:hypothetical protein
MAGHKWNRLLSHLQNADKIHYYLKMGGRGGVADLAENAWIPMIAV